LLAIQVGALEPLPYRLLIAVAKHQLVQELDRHVDIAAQGFGGVPAQEQAVEQRPAERAARSAENLGGRDAMMRCVDDGREMPDDQRHHQRRRQPLQKIKS